MNPIEIVKKYVELSNLAHIDEIAFLLDEEATYSSQNVGMHYKKEKILEMKKAFFAGLSEQNWEVNEYIRPFS